MPQTDLYSSQDRLGRYLSAVRNKNVLPYVRGELLDLACGDNRLVAAYGQGKGIDVVNYGKTDYIVEDFLSLPFADQSIDTVTIIASLNYFEDPAGVLREVQRILKNDGQLIITMSNDAVMRVWHKFRESWANKPGFNESQIKQLLKQAHLEIVKKIPFMLFLNTIYIIQKEGT